MVGIGCGPSHDRVPADASGSSDAPPGDGGPHTLASLAITPTNPIVQLDLNQIGSQPFAVMGTYLDGTTEDLTAEATWSVANAAVGAMSGATLEIPAFAAVSAEVSKLTATVGSTTTDAQITVVAYRQTGEQTDFFFVLPYADTMHQDKPLDFSTAIPALDVFFLMDATGSMQNEINNLQLALTTPTTGVIDSILATVPNTEFGLGALEDFPVSGGGPLPYGETTATCTGTLPYSPANGDGTPDQPFKLRQTITSNASDVQTAINGLTHPSAAMPPDQLQTIGCGGDLPEAGFEAVYQTATGAGLSGPSPTSVPAGAVGFRTAAMPVIVSLSDAVSHGTDETTSCIVHESTTTITYGPAQLNYAGSVAAVAHSREQTATAVEGICGRFVGIAPVKDCDAEEYMTYLSTQTGARVPPGAWDVGTRPTGCGPTQCCTGQNSAGMAPDADGLCPLVFRVTTGGAGVSSGVTTGIEMLARFAQFDVPTQESGVMTDIYGNALPTGHSTADFLKSVTPSSYVLPPPPPDVPPPTIDANKIQFDGVTPGTQVTFTIDAYNDFVAQTDQAQIFEATISVLAGGCNVLDQRTVLILVPPMPIVLQ
ncbi:MAG TPA: hypothetical protein VH143_10115 [Kofleriaceae bacterium]|nr:hypothetical protein [Kofleriaceae bacterium]